MTAMITRIASTRILLCKGTTHRANDLPWNFNQASNYGQREMVMVKKEGWIMSVVRNPPGAHPHGYATRGQLHNMTMDELQKRGVEEGEDGGEPPGARPNEHATRGSGRGVEEREGKAEPPGARPNGHATRGSGRGAEEGGGSGEREGRESRTARVQMDTQRGGVEGGGEGGRDKGDSGSQEAARRGQKDGPRRDQPCAVNELVPANDKNKHDATAHHCEILLTGGDIMVDVLALPTDDDGWPPCGVIWQWVPQFQEGPSVRELVPLQGTVWGRTVDGAMLPTCRVSNRAKAQ